MSWLINSAGALAIALIVWWFWLYKPRATKVAGAIPIDITVADGIYTPARIEIPVAQPVTLRFLRKDPNPCAAKVLFDTLNVSADLPINKPKDVVIQAPRAGEFEFTCEMHMYRGTLVAR